MKNTGYVLVPLAVLGTLAAIFRAFSEVPSPDEVPGYVPGGRFPVTTRPTNTRPEIAIRGLDGALVTASCTTCHIQGASAELPTILVIASHTPDPATGMGNPPTGFHTHVDLAHGDLHCLSCHNAKNYDTFALAYGAAVEFDDVMTLCAQCHGPQTSDYRNGSHGGMTGYWDLSRGPRERNSCIHCHHPHHPAYPAVMPARGPNDRFLPRHERITEERTAP